MEKFPLIFFAALAGRKMAVALPLVPLSLTFNIGNVDLPHGPDPGQFGPGTVILPSSSIFETTFLGPGPVVTSTTQPSSTVDTSTQPGLGGIPITSGTNTFIEDTSTWTGLSQSISAVETDTACLSPGNCAVDLNVIVLVPASTSVQPTITNSVPAQTSSTANGPSSTAPSSNHPPGASSPTSSTLAATFSSKQTHNRTQILLGGILGGLSSLAIIVAILFMLRRRRLQRQQRDSQFLVDPEEPNPPQPDTVVPDSVSESVIPTIESGVHSGIGEKALFRRAELQQQVQQIEDQMAELQRVATRFNVANPSSSDRKSVGGGANGVEVAPNTQLATLRARVRELESQRDSMWGGEAPPGYHQ
ncbi:hypothetical protein DFH06DRAFT_1478834 [Mycena polygramma]|nr:hypothetical protein DFH06DRAFT_1478834 [Mycena polygramma]